MMQQSFFARRRRDSNPRAPEGKRISSAPRYDRFDTSPFSWQILCRLNYYKVFRQTSQLIIEYLFQILYNEKSTWGETVLIMYQR